MPAGPGQIIGSEIDGVSNAPFMANVGSDGRLWVDVGGDIVISGVTIDNVVIQDVPPTDATKNNPAWEFGYIISGTSTGVTGSSIGTIVQHIGTGSYVQSLVWDNDLITNVGSWA